MYSSLKEFELMLKATNVPDAYKIYSFLSTGNESVSNGAIQKESNRYSDWPDRSLASESEPDMFGRPKDFDPTIRRPVRKIPKVYNVPPPNFSVPPPPIPGRFSVPPPPINPCVFKPVEDAEDWISEYPEVEEEETMDRSVETPTHDYEIGFWFGVPMTTKSILKKADMEPMLSCNKTKRNVKYSEDVKVFFDKRRNSDNGYSDGNDRPKSCKIPERFPYRNFPSSDVIKALNEELDQLSRDMQSAMNKSKNRKKLRSNYQNLSYAV